MPFCFWKNYLKLLSIVEKRKGGRTVSFVLLNSMSSFCKAKQTPVDPREM